MKEVIICDNNENIDLAYDSKIIKNEFMGYFNKNKGNIAIRLREILSGIENFNDIIKPERTYIAKFPKDVLEKINSGQYEVMKAKNGDILSTIIDTTLPKNRNIVHQIRLDVVGTNVGEKIKDLSTNVMNLALQQQLANISEMLNQIQNLALDIKRGQVLDRIGLIMSGKNQLEQAMQLDDTNPNKEFLVINALKSLNDGRSQLELYLRDELKKEIDIPNNKFRLFFKSFFNSQFYTDVEKQFGELQEGLTAYFKATSLLVVAYEVSNSKEAIPKVFEPVKELIEISHKKMNELSVLALDGKVNNQSQWYKQPQVLISDIENFGRITLPQDIEYISIEFTGNKFLAENENE